jgi:hypothetical protein
LIYRQLAGYQEYGCGVWRELILEFDQIFVVRIVSVEEASVVRGNA